ncbi:MAG: hypothetical protein EOP58_02300 [Sphingomonadales bacterium]|nr:MAG: hypothetical protein EOP58_02300 [Sphingomonadales bacterium]
MSIKDWASYAFVSSDQRDIGWVWAQEYPWDVLSYNSVEAPNFSPLPAPVATGPICIPASVESRFWDGSFSLPPSAIAQFGVTFVGRSRWLVLIDDAQPQDEIIQMTHTLTYWQGSHFMGGPSVSVVTADTDIETVSLNLPVLAIQPIVAGNVPAAAASATSPATPSVSNGAVLAFVQSEFIVPPTAGSTPFRAKSGANNLYVRGTGFAAPARGDGVLTAASITAAAPATLTLQFKITRATLPLSLFLRHWKTSGAGCTVTIAVNEADPAHPIAPIVLELGYGRDDTQASELTSVVLRDTDIASRQLRDYLMIGLNQIVITVTPAGGEAECGYALRGLAIG